ncbi:MAG: hypothetical protein JNM85_10855 [Chthonomonas sp.]|nr:hypothetical protein [Chthonomonas sp.]
MNQILDFLKGLGPTSMMIVIGAVICLAVLIGIAWFVATFLKICPPNEVLIVSGQSGSRTADGRTRGFRTVMGGRALTIPFFQSVSKMTLTTMEVPIQIRNAYSSGGIAMNVEAMANVKISSDETVIANAIERFLNRDLEEVRRVAKETLEGHLRGVVARLTPEQVNEDRLTFADALATETEEDLRKLGMHLDTLKILHVSDEVGYLDAIGRAAIANVVRSAEMAESDMRRKAEQSIAENVGRADQTKADMEAMVFSLKNELRTTLAELDASVKVEEEKTLAAAREARAKAEQELQGLRAELEAIRLQVDTVLPAEAQRQAEEYRARGEAAILRERGQAVSQALQIMNEAWKEAGENARQIQLIENLEPILAAAAKGVQKIQIEGVNLIDSGDGQTLRNYVAAYPAILASMFDAVQVATGVDVLKSVHGEPKGANR